MMQWLQNYTGLKTYGENIEISELKNLKKQLKYYKKKYEKEDKEIEILSDKEEEISPEDQKKIDEDMKKRQQKKKGKRNPISNQVYGTINKIKDYVGKNYDKTEDQKRKIKEKLLSIFLFKSLDENELNKIINLLEEKQYSLNEKIVKQGEDSQSFFIIEEGELDCLKQFRVGDPQTYLKTYKSGDFFGELNLLYNSKNPETIIVKSDICILWKIDRDDYYNILKKDQIEKRKLYINYLKQIEILNTLNEDEFLQIADNLNLEEYKDGIKIIKQNESGDKLYIIYEGECQCVKTIDGKPEQKLDVLNVGKYFGDINLLRNDISTFNVVAQGDCKLLVIDRMTFKRLVGPLENLLIRDKELYKKFMGKQ